MMTYDERALLTRLAALNRHSKTAFAASCAERLLPLFERYARSMGAPELGLRLREIVASMWDVASGAEAEIAAHQGDAEALVPSEEDDGWILETGYAQNAAAAAAYAVRTWLTDDAQEAAWAARQVYELADYAVLQSSPALDLNAPGMEARVLASDTVQRALGALSRALDSVEASPMSWQQVRDDAQADGAEWALALP